MIKVDPVAVTCPSLEIAQNIREKIQNAHLGARVCTLLFPQASHNLAGVGTSPERLGDTQFPEAEATANGEAFRSTIAFLKRVLR